MELLAVKPDGEPEELPSSDLPKPKRIRFPKVAGDATIYHEEWWLNAATNHCWDRVQIEEAGRTVAWMPYALRRRLCFDEIVMPMSTHLLGPVIDRVSASASTVTRREVSLTSELISKLPKTQRFSQIFHAGVSNVMAFQAAGFDAYVQHSFIVNPLAEDQLWKNMRDKTRNVIRQSERQRGTEILTDPGEFVSAYGRNLAKRRLATLMDLGRMEVLLQECVVRNRGLMVGLRGKGGNLAAAIAIIWDEHAVYYNLSTRDPDMSDSGAISHLIWFAIKYAARLGKTFDFDGVARMSSAKLFMGFGGRVVSRLGVERNSAFYSICAGLSGVLLDRKWRQMYD